MPVHTGLWLLERVRERAPSIRRGLMSGNDPTTFKGAIDSGLVEMFVQKPLNRGMFLQALRIGQSGVSVKASVEEPAGDAGRHVANAPDTVMGELRAALALAVRVMVVLGGDATAGRPV